MSSHPWHGECTTPARHVRPPPMSTVRTLSALGIRGHAPRAFTLAVTLLAALLWWGGATDRLGPTSADASDITYVYDGLGRLIAVVDPASDTAVFSYDATGNLLSISRQASALVSIIDFSPGSGPVGTTVTIYGTGFGPTAGQNTVTFNGTTASVSSATPTQLGVTVPAGATTGPIAVTAPAGSATSARPFTVAASGAPTITSFTPTVGPAGTAVSRSKLRVRRMLPATSVVATATCANTIACRTRT